MCFSRVFLFLLIHALIGRLFAQFDYTEYGDTLEFSNYMNNATKVRTELFTTRNYDKFLAPVYEPMPDNYLSSVTPRLKIHYMLYYVKLFNLDAESQIFGALIELVMYWRDPRLAWKPAKFGGVESIFIGIDLLWIPDARLSNTKVLDSINGDTMPIARIYSNGTIFLTTVNYVETMCAINSSKFPFDKQNCTLTILSLGLETKYVEFEVSVDHGEQTLTGNGEWDIIEANAIHTLSISDARVLDIAGFTVLVRRVPNFYVYVIALPCFVLTMLAIVGMFWSPNIRKEQLTKLSIGLTSLVSMTVLLDMLAEATPKTQHFPLLGIYVVSCVGITSAACFLVVVHSLPNPAKQAQKELEKLKEENKLKHWSRLLYDSIKEATGHRNFIFQVFFQALNIIGFILFLSFWRN